jgi:hypothetical protein
MFLLFEWIERDENRRPFSGDQKQATAALEQDGINVKYPFDFLSIHNIPPKFAHCLEELSVLAIAADLALLIG